MQKLFLVISIKIVLGASACSFHGKQPVDDTYYKKTQSVGWPD